MAEYLRDKIGTLRFAEINGGLTSSIGVVSYPKHGITAKDILAKADTAIYLAKELGCNRTQLYREGDFLLEKLRSRFKYLQEMEVDYVKIDGSFIRKLHESKTDRLFVKAIADVAQGMGIKTIAEFAENEEAFRILKDIGVDCAQGYLIGKPVPSI